MTALKIIGAIYLLIGFGYAIFNLVKGLDPWTKIIWNILLGPILIVYILYMHKTNKRLPVG